jgi:DNA-binding response OmpR family regulator
MKSRVPMTSDPLRILIVEDQFLIARQIEVILTGAGYRVVGTATDRVTAEAMAATAAPNFALVDLSLADGVTGADIAAWLIATRDIDVVFTTANSRRLGSDYGGAIGVIEKPFTRVELLAALRYLDAALHEGRTRPARPAGLRLSPDHQIRWQATDLHDRGAGAPTA